MFIQLMLPEMTLRSGRSTPSCWSKAARILVAAGPSSMHAAALSRQCPQVGNDGVGAVEAEHVTGSIVGGL
jgi:hypothetical protein